MYEKKKKAKEANRVDMISPRRDVDDPAEVVATTPVVGTAMMTAMVMMATIIATMMMMRRDNDAVRRPQRSEVVPRPIYFGTTRFLWGSRPR